MDNLILIWIFSNVLAWAFASSATSLGDTIYPVEYRTFIRYFAFTVSTVAIVTTLALLPAFTHAIASTELQGVVGGAALTFVLWTAIHLSGAIFTVGSLSYKFANKTL
jgi:hypothetical protein